MIFALPRNVFYQKIRDLFALSSDYDATDKATQMFFTETQNKLLFAVTNKTAAEIIVARANADKPNMALSVWKGNEVRKQDVFIAKNYLNNDEIDTLNRLVVIFLETAELRVKERIDITMKFWAENIDKLLEFNNKKVLKTKGSVSKNQMEKLITGTYNKFDANRKIYNAQQDDLKDLAELKALENKIKQAK